MATLPAKLLREARSRAGLSQRELAARAQTAQSVVARIELGQTSPTWDTLSRLLRGAGFDVYARLAVASIAESHMLADVDRILALTPEDRLNELAAFARFVGAAERV
jgi:transcriptional regulator with XRE-family HTH domain